MSYESYIERASQQYPAKLSAWAELADSRPAFHVARCFADASEGHHATDAASCAPQVTELVNTKRRSRADTPPSEVETIYKPIVGAAEIRVLEIQPATFDQPISGSLHHMSIDFESPERITNFAVSVSETAVVCYTALSYSWGPSVPADSISVDGKALDITKSLDVAIRHLRHGEHSVMIWVDQICINQDDLTEKKTQVALMSLIYQRAWNTVIWLGEKPADEAFDALQTLWAMTHGIYDTLLPEERERICSPPNMRSGALVAVEELFASPWFQRTWTIQEAALSKEPWVMSGTSVRHWEDSIGCCAGIRDMGFFQSPANTQTPDTAAATTIDIIPQKLHGSQTALIIWQMRLYLHTAGRKQKLLEALIQTRHAQAADPLDSVYGVLGLCTHDIVADYTRQATALYLQTALQILRRSIQGFNEAIRHSADSSTRNDLWTLRLLCQIDHPVDELDGSPSWVIDWSRPRVTTSLASHTEVFNCFYAGKASLTRSVIQISDDEKMLRLSAKVFDEVEYLSPIINDADLEASSSSARNSALRTCAAFATSALPSVPIRLSFLGFCHVVTAGKGKHFTGIHKYPSAYTEIISFLCDTVTNQSPTFSDQVYTLRQQKDRMTLHSLTTRSCGRTFQEFKEAFKSAVLNGRLCWTKKGHLGLVPRFAKIGDRVIVVPGAAAPFVIRRAIKERIASTYQIIGECFVDRIMQGEVMADDDIALTDVHIV